MNNSHCHIVASICDCNYERHLDSSNIMQHLDDRFLIKFDEEVGILRNQKSINLHTVKLGFFSKHSMTIMLRQQIRLTLSDEIIEKIFLHTSGNPSVLYQLCCIINESLDGNLAIIHQFCDAKVANLESIILFRFDKLHPRRQAVIKAAVVVGANGAMISARTLYSIIATTSKQRQMKMTFLDVGVCLHRLSCKGSFFRLVDNTKSNYEFICPIERDVIYNLLIDKEKESYHLAAGLIFRQERMGNENKDNSLLSQVKSYYHIGAHFMRAKNHREVIVWYYKAAQILEGQGFIWQCYELLEVALSSYAVLQLQLNQAREANVRANLGIDLTNYNPIPASTMRLHFNIYQRSVFTNAEIRTLCDDSQDVLVAVISMLATLARCTTSLGPVDMLIKFKAYYDEAFSIIQSVIMLQAYQNHLDTGNDDDSRIHHCNDNDMFLLKDTSSVCVLINSYLISIIQWANYDEAAIRSDINVVHLLSNIASFSGDPVHIMRAAIAKQFTYYNADMYDEAIHESEVVRMKYSFDEHHEEMIRVYGSDRVLQCYAFSLCMLAFRGKLNSSHCYLQIIEETLPRMRHLYSIAVAVNTLILPLHILGAYERSYYLFKNYYDMSLSAAPNIHQAMNPTTMLWLTQYLLHYRRIATSKNCNDEVLTANSLRVNDDDMLSTLNTDPHVQRSITLIYRKTFGFSVELMKSEICLLVAWKYMSYNQQQPGFDAYQETGQGMNSNIEKFVAFCETGLRFIDSVDAGLSDPRFRFHTLQCELMKAKLLISLISAKVIFLQCSNRDGGVQSLYFKAQQTLEQCSGVSERYQLHGAGQLSCELSNILITFQSNPLDCFRRIQKFIANA